MLMYIYLIKRKYMSGDTRPSNGFREDQQLYLDIIPGAQKEAESLFDGEPDLTMGYADLKQKFPDVFTSLSEKGLAYDDIKAEVIIGTDTTKSAPPRQSADVVLKITSPQYPEDKVVIVVVRSLVTGVNSDNNGTLDGELVKGAKHSSYDTDPELDGGEDILLLLDHGKGPIYLNPTYQKVIYRITRGAIPASVEPELVNVTVEESRTRGGNPLDPKVVEEFSKRVEQVIANIRKRGVADLGDVADKAAGLL